MIYDSLISPGVADPRDTLARQAEEDAYVRFVEEDCICEGDYDRWCPVHGDQDLGMAALP